MRLPKRNKIDKNKKINFNFGKVYKQSKNGIKPRGFWYSCYNDWYNWVSGEMPEWLYKYIHKININSKVLTDIENKNKDKILVINNLKDFDIFNKRYGHLDKNENNNNIFSNNMKWKNYLVNWDKVSKDYGGIEICPYLTQRKHYLWYNTFDVASGCIWNTKAIIKNSELIYEKKKGKYVKTNA